MPDTMQFDPSNQSLHSPNGTIQLPPKAFGILDYLRQRPHQLVSKEELLNAVWPGLFVTDAVLKVAVGDLRKLLADDPKQPYYIETVHRRGYRFIGQLPLFDTSRPAPPLKQPSLPVLTPPPPTLFGREAAVTHLQRAWATARSGQRQITFVQAEAGFGKTTLLTNWLAQQTAHSHAAFILKAQCLDQYGQSEAYQPFVDALISLLASPQQTQVWQYLRQYAPTWLIQIPAHYLPAAERATLQHDVFGATQGRVVREFADFAENLSQHLPLLLVIEDLHWSDTASVELLALLAYRTNPAKLMIVGSFRPTDVAQHQPRLKAIVAELTLNQKCCTLPLGTLDRQALQAFLFSRLTPDLHHAWLVELFARYTEGNPLFVYTALAHLQQSLATTTEVQADWLEHCISGGLKQLLTLKTAALASHELALLQAASIPLNRITAEALAAILEKDVLNIEDHCTHLLQKAFWLTSQGEYSWPDGSICDSYRFHHQLYREFFYTSLSAARRRHYHLRLAQRLLQAYQPQTEAVASQLAYHFEAGGAAQQAITFAQQACTVASQRFAYAEAIQHLERVMRLLPAQSADTTMQLATTEHYCTLLLASGRLADAIHAYQQLAITSQQAAAPDYQVRALLGLAGALFWIDRQQCLQVGQQAVHISQTCTDPNVYTHANGKQAHWQAIIEGYRPAHAEAYENALSMSAHSDDLHLKCTHHLLYIYYLTIRADYTRACEIAITTQALAKAAGDANHYLASVFFHAWALFYRGEWGEMLTVIGQALQLADKNEYPFWQVHFHLQQACVYAQVGDYATAIAICLPIYEHTRHTSLKTSAYFFSVTLLLQAATGQSQWHTAQQYVEEVTACLEHDAQAIDWVLKLPLQQALTEYWLNIGAWQRAQDSVQQLHDLAAQSGERTYLIRAQTLRAQIALATADSDTAHTLFRTAAQIVQGHEPTVCAWQLYAAQQQWQASAAELQRLLHNLAAYPEVQQVFANNTAVIFNHAQTESVSVD